MVECAVARKGRLTRPKSLVALTLLVVLTLVGCAGQPSSISELPGGRVASSSNAGIAGRWITVQRGDTLGSIAARAGVPLLRLQRFNPRADSRKLAVGQRLLVPSREERAPSGGPYRYQIRAGDTYSSIARHFGSDARRIQNANPGLSPTNLRVGQLLQVPLNGSRAGSRATAASSASASLPDPGKIPSSARGWPWPLDDYRIVRNYGPDARGVLQPMLLATNEGAQALAVAGGQVSFADSMRQLGKVVIVHHSDNLQSVYALCDKVLVKSGQQVSAGTPLCRIGRHSSTGRYDLLFDMRHGGKPINPNTILR